eukprot:361277-Chlamydomonas_euryale.AAC.1
MAFTFELRFALEARRPMRSSSLRALLPGLDGCGSSAAAVAAAPPPLARSRASASAAVAIIASCSSRSNSSSPRVRRAAPCPVPSLPLLPPSPPLPPLPPPACAPGSHVPAGVPKLGGCGPPGPSCVAARLPPARGWRPRGFVPAALGVSKGAPPWRDATGLLHLEHPPAVTAALAAGPRTMLPAFCSCAVACAVSSPRAASPTPASSGACCCALRLRMSETSRARAACGLSVRSSRAGVRHGSFGSGCSSRTVRDGTPCGRQPAHWATCHR